MVYNELPAQEIEKMKLMFNEIDKDRNGYIDGAGVARFLNRRLSRSNSMKKIVLEFEKSSRYRLPSSPKASITHKKGKFLNLIFYFLKIILKI